ncbi:uncharacterized protein LOC141665298 [Apium graveolens]|uniref:uncharacterized protein LOC141665298 n=1 Tax=Apium graveolens TaxID=4045 RepID=UPI003D7ABA53
MTSNDNIEEQNNNHNMDQMFHLMQQQMFQSVKPPEFAGTVDPTKARAWLEEIEKAFALVKVEEDQNTDFASYFLRGEANYSWESKKGNMSMTEYEDKFTELARFVPEQVDTEEKRAKRFQQGLKSWIRNGVAVFELTTYTAVVQKAMIIEVESEMSQKKKGQGNFQNRFNRNPGFQARKNVNFRRSEQGNQRTGIIFKPQTSKELPDHHCHIVRHMCGKKGYVVRDCRRPVMAASVPRVLTLPPPP